MTLQRAGQVAAMCLLVMTGCAAKGERVDLAIPGASSGEMTATASNSSGLRVVVQPFEDARSDKMHLGSRSHFWGGTSYFDLPKGTVGEAVAKSMVRQLNKRGWQASLAGQGSAGQPDVTISGSIRDLSVTAISKFDSNVAATQGLSIVSACEQFTTALAAKDLPRAQRHIDELRAANADAAVLAAREERLRHARLSEGVERALTAQDFAEAERQLAQLAEVAAGSSLLETLRRRVGVERELHGFHRALEAKDLAAATARLDAIKAIDGEREAWRAAQEKLKSSRLEEEARERRLSEGLSAVSALCDRVMVLRQGRVQTLAQGLPSPGAPPPDADTLLEALDPRLAGRAARRIVFVPAGAKYADGFILDVVHDPEFGHFMELQNALFVVKSMTLSEPLPSVVARRVAPVRLSVTTS